jgi:hypothetical protein
MWRPMQAPSGTATSAFSLHHITGYTTKDYLKTHYLGALPGSGFGTAFARRAKCAFSDMDYPQPVEGPPTPLGLGSAQSEGALVR